MNTIYLAALEITAILIAVCTLPMKIAGFVSLIIIGTTMILRSKKELILVILPLMFLLRAVTSIDFTDYNIGSIVTIDTTIHSGFGKIEKIDNRFPHINSYVRADLDDGNYKLTGEFIKKDTKYGNRYYSITPMDIQKIEENSVKKYFREKSKNLLKNTDSQLKKLYHAVILGESYRLPKNLREQFSYIGISHLMALSGFHIGLVILIATWIVSKLPLGKRGKNIILAIFITLYYVGIEHSPSLTRAYIMGMIYLAGNILYENTELMKSLAWAYIISLFINPVDIHTVSFKLSYGAVFIIAGIYPIVKNMIKFKKSKFIDGIILVITIQIFLAPVLINEFGTVQVLGFISNIVIVPLGTLFITLSFIGLLLENIALGFIIRPLMKISYWVFMKGVDIFSSIPLMSVEISKGYGSRIFYLCYFGILLIIIYIKGKKEKTTDEKLYRRTRISQ